MKTIKDLLILIPIGIIMNIICHAIITAYNTNQITTAWMIGVIYGSFI